MCVCKFYEGKIHQGNKFIVNPVLPKISLNAENISTYILQHYQKELTVKRQFKWGRKAQKFTKPKLQQLKGLFDKPDRVLNPSLTSKFTFSPVTYINKSSSSLVSNITKNGHIKKRNRKANGCREDEVPKGCVYLVCCYIILLKIKI